MLSAKVKEKRNIRVNFVIFCLNSTLMLGMKQANFAIN